jgi:hypothetical protein
MKLPGFSFSKVNVRYFLLVHIAFVFFSYLAFPSNYQLKNDFSSYFFAATNAFSETEDIYQFHSKGLIPGIKSSYQSLTDEELSQILRQNPALELILRREEPMVSAWFQILVPPYIYPPFFAYVLHPIAMQGEDISFFVWKLILSLCLVSLPLITARIFSEQFGISKELGYKISVITLLLFFQIVQTNFYWGQVNLLILLLLLGSFLFEKESALLSGFLLSLATLIKITPVIFLLYFFLEKKFKVLFSFAFFITTIIGFCILIAGGARDWIHFFEISAENFADTTIVRGLLNAGFLFNYSAKGFFVRNFEYSELTLKLVPYFSMLILFAVILSRLVWKNKINNYLCISLASVLLSPIIWQHHLILLFPVFCYILYFFFLHFSDRNHPKYVFPQILVFLVLIPWKEIPIGWMDKIYEIRFLNSLNFYLIVYLFILLVTGKFLFRDTFRSSGLEKLDPNQ